MANGGGGTMIIIKKNIYAKQLIAHTELFETCTVQCRINNTPVIVMATYVPNDCKAKYSDFHDFFSQFNSSIIIGGDLNARHTQLGDVKCNRNGNNIYPLQFSGDFKIIHATHPTCHRSNPGSFIDHFVVSSDLEDIVSDRATNIVKLSDHTGIAIEMCLDFDTSQESTISHRKMYDLANVDAINEEIASELDALLIPTTSNMHRADLEVLIASLHKIFKSVIDKHVPTTTSHHNIRISSRSKALLTEKRRLCRLLNRRLNNQRAQPSEIASIHSSINQVGVMIKNSLCDDFSQFYRRRLQQINSNSDAFNTVRQFSNFKRKSNHIDSIFLDENKQQLVSSPEDITEEFASHFLKNHELTANILSPVEGIVQQSINKLNSANCIIQFNETIRANIESDDQLREIESQLPESDQGILTSATEVAEIIMMRKNKTSTGDDNMPTTVLKKLSFDNVVRITIIFNQLLASAVFPATWKHAIGCPIPKPGKDPGYIGNWRPISLLNSISKIFEVIMKRRIRNHFDSNDLFCADQFGFRPFRSTLHALAKLSNNIASGLNSRKITTAVLLDVRAAFDTVWHNGLLHKLMNFGLKPQLCKLIQSYLADRSMSVRMNGVFSARKNINAGVPQGSCVSDILFLAYINDIPSHPGINKSQFADDSLFYRTHKDPWLAQQTFNSYLQKVYDFFSCWKMKICEKKSQFLNVVGRCSDTGSRLRSKAKKMELKINNKKIEKVTSLRYLGMWFQQNATTKTHLDKTINKSNVVKSKIQHLLRNNRIHTTIKTMFYKTIIRPILCYASPIWANPSFTSSAQMERVRVSERKTLRSTTNTRRKRGDFRFANNSTLYRRAETPRIDKFVAKQSVNFIDRCSSNDDNSIQALAHFTQSHDPKYLPVSFWAKWDENNKLMENDEILIFNRGRRDPNRTVYSTNQ